MMICLLVNGYQTAVNTLDVIYVTHCRKTVNHTDSCFVLQQLQKATVVADQFFDLPQRAKKKYAARIDNHGYVESEQEL